MDTDYHTDNEDKKYKIDVLPASPDNKQAQFETNTNILKISKNDNNVENKTKRSAFDLHQQQLNETKNIASFGYISSNIKDPANTFKKSSNNKVKNVKGGKLQSNLNKNFLYKGDGIDSVEVNLAKFVTLKKEYETSDKKQSQDKETYVDYHDQQN